MASSRRLAWDVTEAEGGRQSRTGCVGFYRETQYTKRTLSKHRAKNGHGNLRSKIAVSVTEKHLNQSKIGHTVKRAY